MCSSDLSFTVRDRLRLGATLAIVCATSADAVRAILADLEAILRRQPKVLPDDLSVRLRGLGAAGLELELSAWFATTDAGELAAIRQEVWLAALAAVEARGSAIAYPTQTVHVVRPA